MNRDVIRVAGVEIANHLPFVLIAGPCQIESLEHSLMIAKNASDISKKYGISYIFKSSFDKANRTSIYGKRGVGLEAAKEAFLEVKKQIGCPILTDVHNESQCSEVAPFVDILQIPALLCRQSDLLEAATKTGKVVNVKKGQFVAPWDSKNIVEKINHFGGKNVMLTERGVSFGYNTLVSDMRSLAIMGQFAPVVFDATHSVQQPGGLGSSSGGQREFVPVLARAAIASSPIAAVFAEIHQDPNSAPSDGACMLELAKLDELMCQLVAIDRVIKQNL